MKKRINLKNRKKSKLKKILYLIYFIIFMTSTVFALKYSISKTKIRSDKEIQLLLNESNHNMEYSYDKKNILNTVIKLLSNISINNPSSILSNIYYSDKDEDYSFNSDYIEDPKPKENIKEPLIYIYNTHQLEEYKNNNSKDYSIIPNVMLASYYLREKLNNKNLNTIVETTDINEILKLNNWKYYKSYDVTRMLINSAIEKNKSLNYFIDIHRDSIGHNLTTLQVNNKSFAKVLFIVGLENKNYNKNMVFMDALCIKMNNYYKDICKGLYKKQGEGVNGIYNQDINSNVILIEIGGVENTIEEVTNTVMVFANVLEEYIGDINGK